MFHDADDPCVFLGRLSASLLELFQELPGRIPDSDASASKQQCLSCQGFYTYNAFIEAARSFPGFCTTGDVNTQKKELAAFFGQTSHETTGGWPTAPDSPYSWGYCFKEEVGNPPLYCEHSNIYPCAPGKSYHGREGCQQLQLWAMRREHRSTTVGKSGLAGRLPGYGVITNIINGGLECGRGGPDSRVESRIRFYTRYCDILGVNPGNNLDCYNQAPFNVMVFSE
ncbi:hypothetical protein Dimus_006261 [Dionaea muscipula]